MPNARDIRRRIKSVKNIQQITKAMEMVAAARLRRAQEKAAACVPYVRKLLQMVQSVAAHSGNRSHPLLLKRTQGRTLYLIITADKGLAGAYTSNLVREATAHMKAAGHAVVSGTGAMCIVENGVETPTDSGSAGIIVTGRKGRDYFRRRGYPLINEYLGISERPSFDNAVQIAREVFAGYSRGEYSSVYIAYTHFYSPMNQKAMVEKILPLEIDNVTFRSQAPAGQWDRLKGYFQDDDAYEKPAGMTEAAGMDPDAEDSYEQDNYEEDSDESGSEEEPDDLYIVEPSPVGVLNRLMPQYVEGAVYEALLQSAASELGARMTAMGSATTNAQDIISELTLNYNKVRQSAITREISEIVGGVEALQ